MTVDVIPGCDPYRHMTVVKRLSEEHWLPSSGSYGLRVTQSSISGTGLWRSYPRPSSSGSWGRSVGVGLGFCPAAWRTPCKAPTSLDSSPGLSAPPRHSPFASPSCSSVLHSNHLLNVTRTGLPVPLLTSPFHTLMGTPPVGSLFLILNSRTSSLGFTPLLCYPLHHAKHFYYLLGISNLHTCESQLPSPPPSSVQAGSTCLVLGSLRPGRVFSDVLPDAPGSLPRSFLHAGVPS